jgi:transposase
MLVNAIRGHAAEFGVIAAKGTLGSHDLVARIVTNPEVPALARETVTTLALQINHLDIEIRVLEKKLMAWHRSNKRSRRLAGISVVGPIGAAALAMKLPDPAVFRSGRHFAAWLGLTPRERSIAGRQRLGVITRGDKTLRRLLVSGAMAIVKYAKPSRTAPWLLALLAREPKKLAAVTLANKNARIAWAMMMRGEPYRRALPGRLA